MHQREKMIWRMLEGSKIGNGMSPVAKVMLHCPTGVIRDTGMTLPDLLRAAEQMKCDARELAELKRYLDTPELHDFAKGAVAEAQHQRKRWGAEHDAGKAPEDWFWLIGYLAGKALHAAKAGSREKALHHTISTAAVLANWHAALMGADNSMRPGIDPTRAEGVS